MRNSRPLPSLFPVAVLAALFLPLIALPAQNYVPYVPQGQGQSQNGPQPNYTTDHYTGVVVSSLDGKPIARVLVTSGDRRFAAMSDYEGRFSFDYRSIVQSANDPNTQASNSSGPRVLGGFAGLYGNPRTMPIQFQVRKPGYVSNSVVLYLPATTSGTTQPPLQLKIVPAGVISGHVDPDNGDSSVRLQVQLHRKMIQNGNASWATVSSVQTRDGGEFRFSDLQPGDYKISTSAWTLPDPQRVGQARDSVPGLMPAFYPDALDLRSAGLIHVGPAETVTARLVPRTATFYHVIIPIGGSESFNGASVALQPESNGLNINFNAQDHALEGYLPSGSYTADVITFARILQNAVQLQNAQQPLMPNASVMTARINPIRQQNTSSVVAHFEVGSAPLRAAPVTPSLSADIPVYVHRDFTNPNPSNNNQRVFIGPSGGNRQQMPAVSLYLQPVESNISRGGNLAPIEPGDPDDNLKLQNVTEGVYHVNVQSTQGGYVASATCGTTDLLHDPLTVGASGSAFPIVVTLRDDAASVSGTILPDGTAPGQPPADGGPAAPILVIGIPLDRPEANPLFGGVMGNANAAQRNFQMGMVPPGRYLFLASGRQIYQELEYHNPDVLRDLMSQGVTVTISAGQKTDIQVPLMPASHQTEGGN